MHTVRASSCAMVSFPPLAPRTIMSIQIAIGVRVSVHARPCVYICMYAICVSARTAYSLHCMSAPTFHPIPGAGASRLRAAGPAQPVQPFWLDVTILVLSPVIWQYVVGGHYVRMVTKGGGAYSKNILIRALLVRTSICYMQDGVPRRARSHLSPRSLLFLLRNWRSHALYRTHASLL